MDKKRMESLLWWLRRENSMAACIFIYFECKLQTSRPLDYVIFVSSLWMKTAVGFLKWSIVEMTVKSVTKNLDFRFSIEVSRCHNNRFDAYVLPN